MADKKPGLNWAHWKRLDEWTMGEFVCLLLRVTPGSWFGEYLATGKSRSYEFSSSQNELCDRAAELRDLIWSSHNQYKLNPGVYMFARSPEPMPPGKWIAWARSKEIEIPPELSDMEWVATVLPDLPQTKDGKRASADLKPKEKESLLTLVIAMAIRGYGYDPRAKRSETTSEILGDIVECGLSLDMGTVKKWLGAGAALIEPEILDRLLRSDQKTNPKSD